MRRDPIVLRGLTGVTIEDLLIDTPGDGIVLDHCRDITIARVTINACRGDGIRVSGSTDVSISDCAVYGYDAGTLADGTFGCETPWPIGGVRILGGSRDVTLSTVVFEHCRGLVLDTVDDVTVAGVSMTDMCGDPVAVRGRGRRVGITGVDVRNVMSGPGAVQPVHIPAERPEQCA